MRKWLSETILQVSRDKWITLFLSALLCARR